MDASSSLEIERLKAQVQIVTAHNIRLEQQNAVLRERQAEDDNANTVRSVSAINVESRIKAFQMETERDQMYENLHKLKKKYNQLHEAYLQKVKRCRALEETFKRQKTLSGLVMKSSLDQRDQEQKFMRERLSQQAESLEEKMQKSEASLKEAYDIIDELEFEMESIDFLENENERLRTELSSLQDQLASAIGSVTLEDVPPPSYTEHDETFKQTAGPSYLQRHVFALSARDSVFGDDADAETMERAALTNSLIDQAEAEGKGLRRELLRSRMHNTMRPH